MQNYQRTDTLKLDAVPDPGIASVEEQWNQTTDKLDPAINFSFLVNPQQKGILPETLGSSRVIVE